MLLLELLRMRRRRQFSASPSSWARVVRQEAVLGARVVAGLARGVAAEQF
jgi:hypothetical protein